MVHWLPLSVKRCLKLAIWNWREEPPSFHLQLVLVVSTVCKVSSGGSLWAGVTIHSTKHRKRLFIASKAPWNCRLYSGSPLPPVFVMARIYTPQASKVFQAYLIFLSKSFKCDPILKLPHLSYVLFQSDRIHIYKLHHRDVWARTNDLDLKTYWCPSTHHCHIYDFIFTSSFL